MTSTVLDSPKCDEPSVRLRADSLADGVVILLAVTIVQRTVGFGRGVLFCRWLSPGELGHWEMAYSFLLLAAPLAVLGLPGSFGRYLEHYRQRGQLRTFLRRTTLATSILGLAAVALVALAAPYFSQLIFATSDNQAMVVLLALALGAVVLHHFLESLFTALRMARAVSAMHFCQSIGFAAIGITLLTVWPPSAASVVIAYGSACLISASGALVWARLAARDLPATDEPVPGRTFWPKLMRFAIWVWVANLFANLFAVVDRYMLVHHGGMEVGEAMIQVGHYHSSRVVPLLLVAVAQLLGSLIMPHLSHDWEAGRRREVSRRLNLALKLVALGMMAAAVGVLMIAPALFDFAFAGKYAGGLAVLPWTLTYCVWVAITVVASNYLWCAERVRLCTLPLLAGLIGNVALNLVLLPRLGLLGAVLATTAATLLALAMTYLLSRTAGMHLDGGTLLLSAAPLALGFGLGPALAVLLVCVLGAVFGDRLLSRSEKRQLALVVAQYATRVKDFQRRRRANTRRADSHQTDTDTR